MIRLRHTSVLASLLALAPGLSMCAMGRDIPGSLMIREQQRQVVNEIQYKEGSREPPCTKLTVQSAEVIGNSTGRLIRGGLSVTGRERWRVDRCGSAVNYLVNYTTFLDGSDFHFVTDREP